LEDYFHRCGFSDPDQYAVNLAALYDRKRHPGAAPAFLLAMKRLRTSFYKQNSRLVRPAFEKRILKLLDDNFKKKERIFDYKGRRGKN
jgi:hypothetical protein